MFRLIARHARTGERYFYTGKAGPEYVILATEGNKAAAFTYEIETGAVYRAAVLNRMEPLTGLLFEVEAAA